MDKENQPDQLQKKIAAALTSVYGELPAESPKRNELNSLIEALNELVRQANESRDLWQKNQERFDTIADEVDDYAILLLDTEGTIRTWNRGVREIKGYNREEIIGKSFQIFYSRQDLDSGKPMKLLETARKEGRAEDESFRVRKDGSKFWGGVSITALHDENNKVTGFLKVTRDLTERKQAEDKLREQKSKLEFVNRELESFSYSVSHDLRSPLRAVQGYSTILYEEFSAKLGKEGNRVLENINQNAIKMGTLIDDLLAFSRLSRQNITRTKFDTGHLIKAVLNELSYQRNSTQISVKPMPEMKADYSLMSQVFINLISNALKFTSKKEEPQIEIGATETEKGITWYVRDNGDGFDMKYYDKLFRVFQRLHREEDFEGTGVGLAIVQRVISRHGGEVWAEGSPGEGATFYFTVGTKDSEGTLYPSPRSS